MLAGGALGPRTARAARSAPSPTAARTGAARSRWVSATSTACSGAPTTGGASTAPAAASSIPALGTGGHASPGGPPRAGRRRGRGPRHRLPRSRGPDHPARRPSPRPTTRPSWWAMLPTLRTRGSAGLLADNFLDVAHFPFVHAGTFGAEEAAEVTPFAVARDGWSFTVTYEHAFANREDPGVAAGLRPLVQTRRLTYVLQRPLPPPAADRLRRLGRLQRDRLLHPARDRRDVPAVHDACGATTSTATRRAWPRPWTSSSRCSTRTCGSRRRTTTSRCRSTPRPRCTPGPTATRSSCAGCWPTWWRRRSADDAGG